MRPIDADAVIEEIKAQARCAACDNYNGLRCRACSWDDAMALVDDFADNHPMPEQPEIVRCKDCVNCIKEPNEDLYCDVLAVGYEPLGSKRVTENWFCADGKRKEERR